MRQFRSTPIFTSASDVATSSLPRGSDTPSYYVPPPSPRYPGNVDAVSGAGKIATDAELFELHIEAILDKIAATDVGKALLGALPGSWPILIVNPTDAERKSVGELNAVTTLSQAGASASRASTKNHIKIIFPIPTKDNGGPGTKPHEMLMHELVHALDMATHGGVVDMRGMSGKVLGYDIPKLFTGIGDFFAILITNIMISEYSTQLRLHHHGYAIIPESLRDSKTYYKTFEKPIELLWEKNRNFMIMISNIRSPKFNPLVHHFMTYEDI